MKGKQRINEMYAYVVVDDDGTEGVPAFRSKNGLLVPLVGADTVRAEALKPMACLMAKQLGKTVTLIRFTVRETVEVIEP